MHKYVAGPQGGSVTLVREGEREREVAREIERKGDRGSEREATGSGLVHQQQTDLLSFLVSSWRQLAGSTE